MITQFYKPRNEILKKYIDGYYFMSEETVAAPIRYWSFPNNYTILTISQNADVILNKNSIIISSSTEKNLSSHLYYNNSAPVEIHVKKPVTEINIYFKPLGILQFQHEPQFEFQKDILTDYNPHPDFLTMMSLCMSTVETEQKIKLLEDYWLSKLQPKNLSLLEGILTAVEQNQKVSDIAEKNEISRQYLHKLFFKYLGKSPAEYRKTHRFKSIIDNYKTEKNFTELSHKNCFFDQAHFNRDFKQLTGINPGIFFKKVDTTDSNFWLFVEEKADKTYFGKN